MSAGSGAGPVDERVDELVDRCRRTVPFYRERLPARRVPFDELPTFGKADLRDRGPRPLAADTDRASRFCATSGTTGPRLLVGFSASDWARLGDQLGRRGADVGLGPGDLVANTHGYGLWIGGPALDLVATGAGAALLPIGPGQLDQLSRWMEELPITAISATPSLLRLLAERAERGDLDPSRWSLRMALTGGEPAPAELRRSVVRALGGGMRWQELYGASEVGGPTLGWSPPDDPYAGALHVDRDEFVVEILQVDADEPAGSGETGEVTVTTPFREVDPLIRYRTRDLASWRPDGTMSTITGRIDDALKVRGALFYPSVVESVLADALPIGAEWRIVVDREPGEFDVVTVVVEAHPEGADIDTAGDLVDRIHAATSVRPSVTVVPPGSLDRFEGKARRVEDRR